MSRKRRSPVLAVLWMAGLVYLGMLVMLTGCQKRYIYFPERAEEKSLKVQATALGLEDWRDGEGELIGWRKPAPPGSEPIRRAVVFQGNAGMAIGRFHYVEGLQGLDSARRWEVYLFEYPGYGTRLGEPGETVFYRAARDALNELFVSSEDPLYLVGESLGSGVASRMASEFPDSVSGLLLVTPYTTLPDVAARHFWGFPVRLLLRERYNNIAALKDYHGPVGIVLAEYDEIIPADLGQRLFDVYHGPKEIWIQKGETHNTLDLAPRNPWWEELTRFLEKHTP